MAAVILIWFGLLLRKEVCYAVTSVNILTDILIPSIGEDIHLLCNFMPSNQHADVLITKDKVTRLASKICFNDGDCNNYNSNSGKMTWQTDASSAELTINKWSMSDRGDYQCVVDNTRSNTLNLREIMPEQPDTPEIMLNNLRAGEETKINCTSNNGYPSPAIYWYVESTNLTMNSSIQTEMDENGRWKATSILTFTPSRYDHGKGLICQVVQPTARLMSSQNDTMVLDILYLPIISLRLLDNEETVSSLTSLTSVEFECTSDANPKVLNLYWYHNQLIIVNSTGQLVVLDIVQRKTVSTSRLIINDVQRMHSGKYECHVITVLGNATATLNFSYISDRLPLLFIVQNQTTSSTLFVSWQPGFDGGFQQTFNLEYCPNNTLVKKGECGVVTNFTETSSELDE
ncbi:sialic acid-binding Ig-like lectin 12 [Lytechinus pictus]|uniref:sialic acid-binding Ig-like lectin 12 n=1 Tax=Lytechinus pictus TaxID=7653 RepID=UPI0030BA08DC